MDLLGLPDKDRLWTLLERLRLLLHIAWLLIVLAMFVIGLL